MKRSGVLQVILGATAMVLILPLLLVLVVLPLSDRACGATASGPLPAVDGYSPAQVAIARLAISIGHQRGIDEHGITAAMMAAAAESGFRNYANINVPESLRYDHDAVGSDYDSVGPWQLRASVWGAMGMAQLMDPAQQATWFYDQLDKLPGWHAMAPEAIAQAIEKSAVPDAYAPTHHMVRTLLAVLAPVVGGTVARCLTEGPVGPGARVVELAARWIDWPYVWGGGDPSGPTNGGFDCSGLVLHAVHGATGGRITLPHYTQSQQDDPHLTPIAFDARQPGDLIFFTTPGSGDSHHVAIYAGQRDGADIILHAPTFGVPVGYARLDQWVTAGERLDIRRVPLA
ncbi:peptidoglycan endopeptidase [Nocardia panacis]|uniref:Peptidoglycan endopeptidase n=1 Tax=Nocardia panacis TaxID=2340916 RepID=A0A3A4KSA4_9NOCA|nr:C40 family peptidase [Nocardia panacis]RJO77650.1 peptidoglycan endopeptidase [Nocardia panacis]